MIAFKYFLKKLGMTVLYGVFMAGMFTGGIHVLDDYTKNMDRIQDEEDREKENRK
jgi:hypothetical protein